MTAINLRSSALAFGLAATLAACSPAGQGGGDASSNETTTAVPADPGRGAMLAARAHAVQAGIERRRAEAGLPPETADRMSATLAAIRGDLSAALSNSSGPLPRVDRLSLSDRLSELEAELAGSPPAAAP